VTYQINGVQYVSVMAGWGGSDGLSNLPGWGPMKPGYSRILTFTLDGAATLKPLPFGHKSPPSPAITTNAPKKVIEEGGMLFAAQCSNCHGVNAVAGPLPDLRYSSKEVLEGIDGIVLGGSRAQLGMPSFQKILSHDQVLAIQAYIVSRAKESAQPGK